MPANFKTYEAQARLLAAVIAAHPELRLNQGLSSSSGRVPTQDADEIPAIAQHYGKTATMSAIEHRFRPVRKQADGLRLAVTRGDDPEEVDIHEPRGMKHLELAKYFGESTADGLQFQFRGVKQAAEAMRNAADNGNDPVEAFNNAGSGAAKTPSGRKRGRQPGGTPASGRSRGGGTPPRASYVEPKTTTDKDESAASVDYDALDDDSPTGHLAKKTRTTPIKTALPPRRMSGSAAPIAQPLFKTEPLDYLDETFEVSDRLPSPSPMPLTTSAASATISATGSNAGNGDYFGSSNTMARNDRAASEYHTPAPEFPPTAQSQSQSQSQSISYSNGAGMSFDGGVSTSFASSTTNIFGGGGNTSVSNNYNTSHGFHSNSNGGGYSQQQSQQTAGYINIVSDDEDDHSQSQGALGAAVQRTMVPSNGHGGQGHGHRNFSQPSFTMTNAGMGGMGGMGNMGMGMNLPSTMNGNGGDMGSFYVDEDQYEI
ncbi:unnamed protein product [Sordaria macrospora k-hell]|uniref:WGS project CABT00000000 data, contig 2.37 n=2 Tax=Sordaria macrospora TaxID=5147 RepID=F7W702_SORMK|nr:uncharacterized protein SMAC_06583 [Sordaria macrospora k-hell]CCC13292.1 unnamed protein product [Sordaria macrospora k-hell]